MPEEILEELRYLVLLGLEPKAIVGAFLASISVLGAECGCSRQFVRRLRSRHPKGEQGSTLEAWMPRILAGMTADRWD